MGIVVLIIGIAYLPLQIAVWKKWQGAWFYLSFVPAGVPLVACAVGLAQGSNLWPFWGAFALPESAFVLGVIWCFRWLMQHSKKNDAFSWKTPPRNAGSRPSSDDSPTSETPSSLGPRD